MANSKAILGTVISAAFSVPLLGVGPSLAQITVSPLDEAKPFAPGANIAGLSALNPGAWEGTSAERAVRLMSSAPTSSRDPLVITMLREVALSGLAPPAGAGPEFDNARTALARAVATPDEYARFAQRNPALSNDPVRRANDYLAQGALEPACEISDQLINGRGESYWIRLRAACHELRGETAAAELARDILRDRDEETDITLGAVEEGFWVEVKARLNDPAALSNFMRSEATRVAAEDGEADALAGGGIGAGVSAIPGVLDLVADGEQGVAQAYILAEQGAADAMAFVARSAQSAGLNPYDLIRTNQGYLDPTAMAATDLKLFAQFAVMERDVGLLQTLYSAAPETDREAIALASDALGGGFRDGPLGDGIDRRLGQDGQTGQVALHDALVAAGLGARLSDSLDRHIADMSVTAPTSQMSYALGVLDMAAWTGLRAETLLRAAHILAVRGDLTPLDYFYLIRALRTAGFDDLAGQIGAREFLRTISGSPAGE